jgi:hypothetical protein
MYIVKESYKDKVVSRVNKVTGSTITINFATLKPERIPYLVQYGFADCFEIIKKEVKLNVNKIIVQVDNLADLTYAELKQQAKEKGIDFPANIKKVDLIALINQK